MNLPPFSGQARGEKTFARRQHQNRGHAAARRAA